DSRDRAGWSGTSVADGMCAKRSRLGDAGDREVRVRRDDAVEVAPLHQAILALGLEQVERGEAVRLSRTNDIRPLRQRASRGRVPATGYIFQHVRCFRTSAIDDAVNRE